MHICQHTFVHEECLPQGIACLDAGWRRGQQQVQQHPTRCVWRLTRRPWYMMMPWMRLMQVSMSCHPTNDM